MTGFGHNGGPPLDDEHVPEWEDGDPGVYFAWKDAHAAVWKRVPWETMLRRQERAERIGLTYEEYTLEILERGRHLGLEDVERVEAIKRARPGLMLVEVGSPGVRSTVPRALPLPVGRGSSRRRRPG